MRVMVFPEDRGNHRALVVPSRSARRPPIQLVANARETLVEAVEKLLTAAAAAPEVPA